MAQNLVLNILAKDKTKRALSGVQASLTRLRSTVFSVQSALIGLGAGVLVKSFVDVGRSVEELGIRFNFLFGSAREGAKAFDTLINFASRVPFSLEEISTASGNLAVVSKDAKELEKNLKIVGNVASVTGLDFRTTAEQIQRSFAGGIASADIFRERGVRALLGFQAGATVTAEETAKAFEATFGENGRFGKATEVFATTFTGTLSMLSDKLFKFRLETSRAGFFDFLKAGLIVINKRIEENGEALSKFSEKLGLFFVSAIKNIVKSGAIIINTIKPIFKFIIAGFQGLFDIFKALPAGAKEVGVLGFILLGTKGKILLLLFGDFIRRVNEFSEKFAGVSKKQKENLTGIDKTLGNIDNLFEEIENEVVSVNSAVADMFAEIEKANQATEKSKTKFGEIAGTVKSGINKPLEDLTDIAKQVTNVLNVGIKGFSKGIAESIVLGKELKATFKSIAQTLITEILATIVEIVARKAVELALEKAISKQKQIQAVLNQIGGFFGGFKLPFMANGGAVQKGKPVVVGERGAELFIPNQTGQITQSARGTNAGAVNVNFTINAVDTAGIDRLLVERRGTISRIINESVNERGSSNLI